MYNPHLLECADCLIPFKDGDRVYHWFEHYLCGTCAPVHALDLESHIWSQTPLRILNQPVS